MADSVLDLLKQVQTELKTATENYDKKAEEALNQARKSGDVSAETKAEVDRLATTFNSLSEAEKRLTAKLEGIEQEIVRIPSDANASRRETAGHTVIKSEALKTFTQNVERGKSISIPVQNAVISTDIPEGVVEPTRLPGIDKMPKQRLFVRDLISTGKTNSSVIFWIQQTGFTNKAAAIKENTTKPYSDIKYGTKHTPVTTIAHMFKASKQILDDFAQLQTDIDIEMRYGLKYVEEQEILFGDGTDPHLEGIVPQASAFNALFEPEMQNNIDILRLAMLQAQLARLPATGHVLHYIDWAKIELTKDKNGQYIFANPLSITGPVMWGLPVVPTEIEAFKSKFLTGAFQAGATIYDREEANVVISTENTDDFEKNMISIRCEERLALAVKRPEAFIFGDFPTATTNP